jgi:hypothetical protein
MTKYKMTKSDKARKLLKQGYSVIEVAKRVGMNYGHAWNVMRSMTPKTEEPKIGSAPMYVYGVSESELASNPNYRNQQSKVECCGQPEDNTVEQVLEERGKDYGDYVGKALFIQGVKYLMRKGPSWNAMDADMRESMEMIAHKMGRVVYGDPNYADSWIDIAGYAKLVADRLEDKVQ